jgi:hypothetical protein
MSGVSGSDRISRSDFLGVMDDYEKKILKKIKGYKSYEISGSFNSDKSKMDFGDMDIIVHIESNLSKKDIKKDMGDFFSSLPNSIIVPFTSDKYKGRKFYNSGEIITVNYPQGNGKTVQIDNIIALDKNELEFKKEFLDMPAAKQGLVLGLIKISIQENAPEILAKKMNISIPPKEDNEKYEFNLSSVELQLRAIVEEEIDGKIKQTSKRVIWKSTDWTFVSKILYKYDLSKSFDELVEDAKKIVKNKRGLQRVVGIFKSMISVKSGEVNTPKGIDKEKAIQKIEKLIENSSFKEFILA